MGYRGRGTANVHLTGMREEDLVVRAWEGGEKERKKHNL